MVHYVVVCPEKKNKKGKEKTMATSTEIEGFSERFDREFVFIACEASSAVSTVIQVHRECALSSTSRASSSIWYVDSGASRHMIGVRKYFSELSESDTDMEVVVGDDKIVRAIGVRILTFDREPKPPLRTLREITIGVPDFSSDHLDVCKGCVMGKFAKSPFPSNDSRAIGILDLIHSDVSGRMSHVSLSGYEYYVLFIDDHSRKT